MRPVSLRTRSLAVAGALVAGVLATTALAGTAASATTSGGTGGSAWSAALLGCAPGALGTAGGGPSSAARVADGATAKEPRLYPDNQAQAYGAIKDSPRLADGSVTIDTVVHVVTDRPLSAFEQQALRERVEAQVAVLNASFSGETADGAADSPFRFDLVDTAFVVDAQWASVTPGKVEREMKAELHEGDATTLNVYVAGIGDGLLGWSYFPKASTNGRGYLDGVVLLDETLPGGVHPVDPSLPWGYGQGDTLTHEVGHWLALEHTFAHGCSAAGDFVADTPKQGVPHFGCPEGADTCDSPGLDPVTNFMSYAPDACLGEFTPGQVERMNDAWIAFRAGDRG